MILLVIIWLNIFLVYNFYPNKFVINWRSEFFKEFSYKNEKKTRIGRSLRNLLAVRHGVFLLGQHFISLQCGICANQAFHRSTSGE